MAKGNTMKTSLFSRYTWLIETIGRNGRIAFEGIDQAWMLSSLNQDKEHLPKKTFQNHCAKIKELFGFDILCDKKDDYRYYIDNAENLERGDIRRWLFNSISVNNMMNEYPFLKNRVIFDRTPDGHRCLLSLLRSMKTGLMVRFCYRSFRGGKPMVVRVAPYCIRAFKLDWYLLGKMFPGGHLQIFSLDRISEIEITGPTFILPVDFNGEKIFSDFYGALITDAPHPQEIKLKVKYGQQEFFRVRPLHHTQREVETTPEYSVFSYRLCPTTDFIQAVLSQGYTVEVLEPQSLRESVTNNLQKSIEMYSR